MNIQRDRSTTRPTTGKGRGGAGTGPSTGDHGKPAGQESPTAGNKSPGGTAVQPDPPKDGKK